jgi:hypothetical protein
MELPPDQKISVDGKKMRELADKLKAEIPGCGFALLVYDFENEGQVGNYIANVSDDFMIKALGSQLDALKKNKTFLTPENQNTGV